MKVGVVFFHSDIQKIYKDRWIKKSVDSILNQTFKDFSIYEINYSSENENFSVIGDDIDKKFWSKKMTNYAEAMNFIITEAFLDGCDYVFNTNLDDYYDKYRFESQLNLMKVHDFDLLSSDFCYIVENTNNEDEVSLYMNIVKFGDIKSNLFNSNNVIAHPCVCYSRRFWIDPQNRYDVTKVPEEDYDLWKRSILRDYKFGIDKNLLLYYRRHDNQVSEKK
jgi:hypothetical protein